MHFTGPGLQVNRALAANYGRAPPIQSLTAERSTEERRKRGFADAGVGAGNEKMIPHEQPAASGTRWARHDDRQFAS